MEPRYTVTQASEMTGVKSYVLRYWEEELDLRIQRNELGHRCYTRYDIQLFLNIKELKKRGLQLRAIKELVPQIAHTVPGSETSKIRLLESEAEVLNGDSPSENSEKQCSSGEAPQGGTPFVWVENEKILEFQAILERLITQEIQSKNEDEERCRSLDLAIRRQQMARREAAAAAADKKQRKKRRKM